jgi:putative tributyrin esterase
MTKYARTSLALVLFALVFLTGVLPLSPQTSTALARPAVQASAKPQDGRVQTVQLESKLIGATLPYNVLLPVDYNLTTAKSTRYPVLYLLHGLFGHYNNWIEKTKLDEYTTNSQFIIVMPEGNNSWYTDSAAVATDKYESYIMQELIPDVDKRFRTISAREGRAIAGLSMGGYGALKFGVKYPQQFVFVGSMSGALGAATWTETDLKGLAAIWRTLQPVYGPENSPTRAANDLGKLYREFPGAGIASLPYVYLDCGTEDPLLQANRSFVDILMTRKIPHEFRQLPGGHAWTYWDAQVQEILRIAAKRFGK